MVYGPTGSGKTRIFSDIVAHSTKPVWVLVNRYHLLKSAVKTIQESFTPESKFGHLAIQELRPKSKKFNPDACIVVAMVQTLKRRDYDLSHVGLLIVDEAHLTDFDDQIERFPNAYRLGFSATPKRKGRQRQLTDFYTKLIHRIGISQLLKDGYLVGCKEHHFTVANLKDLKLSKGDFDEAVMYCEFDKKIIYSGVVDNWLRICPNLQTLVF